MKKPVAERKSSQDTKRFLGGALAVLYIAFLLGGIVVSYTGCSAKFEADVNQKESELNQLESFFGNSYMVVVDSSNGAVRTYTLVDLDTRVMYMYTWNSRSGSTTMVPLYDASGTLKRYNGPLD